MDKGKKIGRDLPSTIQDRWTDVKRALIEKRDVLLALVGSAPRFTAIREDWTVVSPESVSIEDLYGQEVRRRLEECHRILRDLAQIRNARGNRQKKFDDDGLTAAECKAIRARRWCLGRT